MGWHTAHCGWYLRRFPHPIWVVPGLLVGGLFAIFWLGGDLAFHRRLPTMPSGAIEETWVTAKMEHQTCASKHNEDKIMQEHTISAT